MGFLHVADSERYLSIVRVFLIRIDYFLGTVLVAASALPLDTRLTNVRTF